LDVGARIAAILLTIAAASAQPADEIESAAEGDVLEFTHVLNNAPLDVLTPRASETFTEAVDEFHGTGQNPYSGDAEAISDGQRSYNRWCQACHLRDGSGRIGPPLNDTQVRHERASTDKGMFEIIYGGAAGAMQPFGRRIDQDEILRLMAFLETL
jgi:cytochrome c-L